MFTRMLFLLLLALNIGVACWLYFAPQAPASQLPATDPGVAKLVLLSEAERPGEANAAELATAPDNRHKLQPGTTAVTASMVDRLESEIDALDERFEPPTEFVVPGGNITAAWLDLARTVVRRAERHSLAAAEPPSLVVPYLNRLSDLLWTMARLKSPRESGETRWASTDSPPADWPAIVTLSGSPPNSRMLCWTHRRAAC